MFGLYKIKNSKIKRRVLCMTKKRTKVRKTIIRQLHLSLLKEIKNVDKAFWEQSEEYRSGVSVGLWRAVNKLAYLESKNRGE